MENLATLGVDFLVLILSMIGYIGTLKKITNIKEEFLPVIVFSIIGIVIFFTGIFEKGNTGLINVQSAILLIGIILLIVLIFTNNLNISKREIVFWSIAFIFGVLFKDIVLIKYDDFSHWALIVKYMLTNNTLPAADDQLLLFKSYTTGTAGFIYYICKSISQSETYMLWGHTLLKLGCIYSVFAFIKPKKYVLIALTLICSIGWINSVVSIICLSVDLTLTLYFMTSLSIIIFYKDQIGKMFFCLIPVLMYFATIKNSSVVFIYMAVFLAIYYIIKSNQKRIFKLIQSISLLSIYVLIMKIWNSYLLTKYGENLKAKHYMNAKNYESIFESKTSEDLLNIKNTFFDAVFSLNNVCWIILLLLVLISVIIILLKVNTEVNIKSYIIISLVLASVYYIGLYFMYIYSMPTKEALTIAGFDRYNRTLNLALAQIIFIEAMQIINGITKEDELSEKQNIKLSLFKKKRIDPEYIFEKKKTPLEKCGKQIKNRKNIFITFILLIIAVPIQFLNLEYETMDYIKHTRKIMEKQIVQNENFDKDGSYLIISEEGSHADYKMFVLKYELLNENIQYIEKENFFKANKQYLDQFNYYLISTTNKQSGENLRQKISNYLKTIGVDNDKVTIINF